MYQDETLAFLNTVIKKCYFPNDLNQDLNILKILRAAELSHKLSKLVKI